jgi:hypothetical protein
MDPGLTEMFVQLGWRLAGSGTALCQRVPRAGYLVTLQNYEMGEQATFDIASRKYLAAVPRNPAIIFSE